VEQVITVGLGEMVVSDNPDTVLVAFGLGSCVGVCVYDAGKKIAGMLHAMLPTRRNGDANRTKFVDTGIMDLLAKMLAAGARREQLIWRYAGGSQMLVAPGLADRFNIGSQNVNMTVEVVNREKLRVQACDTGGHEGRTLRLYVVSGRVTMRKVSGEERVL
jgi:chemotaxis protein CheD